MQSWWQRRDSGVAKNLLVYLLRVQQLPQSETLLVNKKVMNYLAAENARW